MANTLVRNEQADWAGAHDQYLCIDWVAYSPETKGNRRTSHAQLAGRSAEFTPLGKVLTLEASPSGEHLPIKINYEKTIWSGWSWATGEIEHNSFTPGSRSRFTVRRPRKMLLFCRQRHTSYFN